MPTIQEFVTHVTENVENVIIGKRSVIELLMVALLCEGHVLLEDVPGVGKTMLARAIAASMGGKFKRVQCTPDLLPNDVTGVSVYNQKTGAFEIIEFLGDAPDYHFIPVGNAGNITAYWKGYNEFKAAKISKKLPIMMGFQAAGSAPIVLGKIIENPETLATAIRIGNPASWKQAETARDDSGGVIDMVTDDEIVSAYKLLAMKEGIYCEPASAASIAGLIKYGKKKYFAKQKKTVKIVCVLTGHGLKDPDRAIKSVEFKPVVVKPDLKSIMKIIEK